MDLRENLQAYNLYVTNFRTARDTATSLSEEKNGRFMSFLQENNCATIHKFTEILSLPLFHLAKLAALVEVNQIKSQTFFFIFLIFY